MFSDKRYSDDQLDYFNTIPGDRLPKLKQLLEHYLSSNDEEDKKYI